MKNVFIMTNNMNGGGAERVLLTILKHLPPSRFQVELCLVYKEGALLNLLPDGIHVLALFEEHNEQTANLIRTDSGALYRKAVKKCYDIEIAFLEGNAVKIMSQSTNKKAVKIAWVHLDLSKNHYTSAIFESNNQEYMAFASFDRIFCVSSAVRNGLEILFGTALRSKTVVVFNPIDENYIMQLARESTPLKKGVTFCAVGRLVEQKGFDRLLDAAEQLQTIGSQFYIWLLGEGPLYNSLKHRCIESGLDECISFLGFQKNPYPFIKQADVLVSCSRVEGLPMVIGEALILRTPVIATNCSGQAEALQQGKYGLLVENSAAGVYQGMNAFLTGNFIGQEIKYCGPERYLPYDLKSYINRICDLMEQN